MLHEDKGEVSARQDNASMAANKLLCCPDTASVWVRTHVCVCVCEEERAAKPE